MNTIAVYEKNVDIDWLNDAIYIKARKILVLRDEDDKFEYPIFIKEKEDTEKMIFDCISPNDTFVGIIDVESEVKNASLSGKTGIHYNKVWFPLETIKKVTGPYEYSEEETKAIHLIKAFVRS